MTRKKSASIIDRLPLGPISALMLGGASAFFLYAMPADLMERAVGATGIARLIAAAAPPLGETARMLIAGVGGGAAGLATLLIVSLTGRKPRKRAAAPTMPFVWSRLEEEDEGDAHLIDAGAAIEAGATEPADAAMSGDFAGLADFGPMPGLYDEGEPETPMRRADDRPFYADWTEVDLDQEIFAFAGSAGAAADFEPASPALRPAADGSIAELMERLEAGLSRRGGVPPRIAGREGALRAALADIRRMTGR